MRTFDIDFKVRISEADYQTNQNMFNEIGDIEKDLRDWFEFMGFEIVRGHVDEEQS